MTEGKRENNKLKILIRAPSHIHIGRKKKKVDLNRKLGNVKVRYIRTWRLMAESVFTFPIAVGLYPMTLLTEATGMIAKRANSLKAKTRFPSTNKGLTK